MRAIIAWLLACVVMGILGFVAGGLFERNAAGACGTCCLATEECIDADEWAKGVIGQVDDQAANAELSRMWEECQAELDRRNASKIDELPPSTPCALQLSECRGALAECQRTK